MLHKSPKNKSYLEKSYLEKSYLEKSYLEKSYLEKSYLEQKLFRTKAKIKPIFYLKVVPTPRALSAYDARRQLMNQVSLL
jgi:hypothetical protein